MGKCRSAPSVKNFREMKSLNGRVTAIVFIGALMTIGFDVPSGYAGPERRSGDLILPSAPGRKSFFDIFRPRKFRRKQPVKLHKKRSNILRAPRIVEKPKDRNALVVAVFGDEFASDLAKGLIRAFYETPTLRVIDKSKPGSGLADGKAHDWPGELTRTFRTKRVDFTVIMLGFNDRTAFHDGEGEIGFRTEGWEGLYRDRIHALLLAARDGGKPVYWVGLPPVKDGGLSKDLAYLNGLYREAVYAVGGRFVDVWQGFLDADDQYSRTGPDLAGLTVALRHRDGIRFTKAGRRKLAYFVEREIRRDAGYGRALAGNRATETLPPPNLYAGNWNDRPRIGPVISLTQPRLDLGAPLLGARNAELTIKNDTPPYWLVVRGDALPAPSGRADDFEWPPHPYGLDNTRNLSANDLEAEIGAGAGIGAVPIEQLKLADGNDKAAVGDDEFTVPSADYLELDLTTR